MIASLFAVLLASAQPAPAEEPVVTEVEVQTEAEAEIAAEAPAEPVVAESEVAAEADAEAEAAAETEVAAAPAAPEEEIVCRRRLRPSERIGQRHRVVRDCRPASEWETLRRGGD